jgi:hypothetical protein
MSKTKALAEAAVRQIETAYETAQSGGQKQWAAYYQMQLPRAQAIRDRLKGQSGERNTVNGEASMTGKAKKPWGALPTEIAGRLDRVVGALGAEDFALFAVDKKQGAVGVDFARLPLEQRLRRGQVLAPVAPNRSRPGWGACH